MAIVDRFTPGTRLLVPDSVVHNLLELYDYPDPRRPSRIIHGYDRLHALRTSRMCAAVALRLGHDPARVRQYQIACILHDLGRAGLDRKLFGEIWSWAKRNEIPTRPREWRAQYPQTKYGQESEAFVLRYESELEAAGIQMDEWAREQVEMRLGYERRFRRRLSEVSQRLEQLGIQWETWMELVILYYYYPEKLADAEPWVRQLGEILVACEQFEAFNNRERGRDYYARQEETLSAAFAYLEELQREDILSGTVIAALRELAAGGEFDAILAEAREQDLTGSDRQVLRTTTAAAS